MDRGSMTTGCVFPHLSCCWTDSKVFLRAFNKNKKQKKTTYISISFYKLYRHWSERWCIPLPGLVSWLLLYPDRRSAMYRNSVWDDSPRRDPSHENFIFFLRAIWRVYLRRIHIFFNYTNLQAIAESFGDSGKFRSVFGSRVPAPRHNPVNRIRTSRGFFETTAGRHHRHDLSIRATGVGHVTERHDFPKKHSEGPKKHRDPH